MDGCGEGQGQRRSLVCARHALLMPFAHCPLPSSCFGMPYGILMCICHASDIHVFPFGPPVGPLYTHFICTPYALPAPSISLEQTQLPGWTSTIRDNRGLTHADSCGGPYVDAHPPRNVVLQDKEVRARGAGDWAEEGRERVTRRESHLTIFHSNKIFSAALFVDLVHRFCFFSFRSRQA